MTEFIPEFKFALEDGLDETFLPTRSEDRASGWDVRAAETVEFTTALTKLIPLGFRCLAPDGWWLELRPRSSTFAKKNLSALYGVIDESYEGKVMFACQWIPSFDNTIRSAKGWQQDVFNFMNVYFVIEKGERIGQLIPVKRKEMTVTPVTNEEFDRLCEERGHARGAGGFGSTGK